MQYLLKRHENRGLLPVCNPLSSFYETVLGASMRHEF